jgi:site-specific recombinase XerC
MEAVMAQLHRPSGEFQVFSYWTPEGGLAKKTINNAPLMFWPSGRWCLEVNLYFSHLINQGYSLEGGRGGTIGTYAAHLTPLLHYCERLGRRIINLTDGDFATCIKALYGAKVLKKGKLVNQYNRTTVKMMAGTWLSFLKFSGDFHCDETFIGKEGRIRAYTKTVAVEKAGLRFQTVGWSHWSVREADAYRLRQPLSHLTLDKLRMAAKKMGVPRRLLEAKQKLGPNTLSFLKIRRQVMIELFDTVGLRRIEASWLTVGAVKDAISMWRRPVTPGDAPFLTLRTAKKNLTREVAISPVTLQFFEEYLTRRALIVRHLKPKEAGMKAPFFINVKNAGRLLPNTFTQEFAALAKFAGVIGPCSPHMARHRYLVQVLVRLIVAHELETKDDFRRALYSEKGFKEKLRQASGHKSIASLEVYLDLAFDEVAQMSRTMTRVEAQQNFDAAAAANARFRAAMASGVDAATAAADLSMAIDALTAPSFTEGGRVSV